MQTIASTHPAVPPVPLDIHKRAGKYLIFSLGPEEFGTEVLKVREI